MGSIPVGTPKILNDLRIYILLCNYDPMPFRTGDSALQRFCIAVDILLEICILVQDVADMLFHSSEQLKLDKSLLQCKQGPFEIDKLLVYLKTIFGFNICLM